MGGARKYASPSAEAVGGAAPGPAQVATDAPGETWKRSTITPNSSRVMIGDTEQLALRAMQTSVTIDGFRARVVIDYLYANDRDHQLEGTFQLRLPEEASPYFFAFGETRYAARDPQPPTLTIATSGDDPQQLMLDRRESWLQPKQARMVPREQAVVAYTETVQRRVDPALMEWAGAGVFTARVFPLAPRKLHRIVVGYDVDLVRIGGDLEYKLDLPDKVPASVVDISVADGARVTATPTVAVQSQPGRQRFHFEGTQDRTISVRLANPGAPLLVGGDRAGAFFATQVTPALPSDAHQTTDSAVFLVDTSLSSNPDRFNVWLALLRAVLDGNRDSLKRFNVLFFSVDAHWYKPYFIDNTPANVDDLLGFANGLALEGATDLGAALAEATRAQGRYDLFLLSDGAATWGEGNVHALGRTLRGTGSLFAYQTGLAGTDLPALAHLARETGGAVFSVTGESEIARAATAHRARPWQLVDVKVSGASDVMLAGRPTTLFPGQTIVAVGRGAIAAGAELALTVEQAGRREVITTKLATPLASELASRAYGHIATSQLEELEGATAGVAKAYATHFRVTGRTCSLLMLESEADYQRFKIRPDDDADVVKATPAAELFAKTLQQTYDTLGDPKAAFVALLAKLERLPTTKLQIPVSFRTAIAQMPDAAFAVPAAPLATQLRGKGQHSPTIAKMLASHELDYDAITADSNARLRRSPSDALKALSSLVEQHPGDAVLARDVGYSALDLGLRQQAYHLFRRVAEIRPHEPQTYRAMAQALAAMSKYDLALAYYEIALMGDWDARFGELRTIVELDYVRLLRKVTRGNATTSVPEYAKSRLAALSSKVGIDRADLVVTITWNTDNTDVDLHVVEPSGEECFYQHPTTRSGGRITQDVTRGFGPEMYVLKRAPKGRYDVRTRYFASDVNRASARSKVYVTIVENWGSPNERASDRVVTLTGAKELQAIASVVR
jgi:tetratricopeptide (TPR) repeat protein